MSGMHGVIIHFRTDERRRSLAKVLLFQVCKMSCLSHGIWCLSLRGSFVSASCFNLGFGILSRWSTAKDEQTLEFLQGEFPTVWSGFNLLSMFSVLGELRKVLGNCSSSTWCLGRFRGIDQVRIRNIINCVFV